jgi:hypothetical protein
VFLVGSKFTSGDFLEAGEDHHREQDLSKKGWRAYREYLLGTLQSEPGDRLDAAIDFLGAWKALRFKGGGAKLRSIYPSWVKTRSASLEALSRRELVKLSPREFYEVFLMAAELRAEGLPPTCCGKLLHFLVPRAVLLWDGAIVRAQYSLDADPAGFLAYQIYGQRLLRYLERSEGSRILGELESAHARVAGCNEPITRLVDELAYRPDLAAKAVSSLGGARSAFSLPSL